MDRSKLYYVIKNEKETLIECTLADKKTLSSVLKFNGKDWVEDKEVEEVAKKCFELGVIYKLGRKLVTLYEIKKAIEEKRQQYLQNNPEEK